MLPLRYCNMQKKKQKTKTNKCSVMQTKEVIITSMKNTGKMNSPLGTTGR